MRSLSLLLLAFLALAAETRAQAPQPKPQVVKVGVHISPPFVMKEASGYSGMAIDLWQKIASELAIVSVYEEFEGAADLVNAAASGTIQAAVANLSITKSRAQIVEFTQPWFDAGLRVMVHSDARTSMTDIVHDLWDTGHLANFAWIAVGMLLATAFMTLLDRKLDGEFHKRWRDGLAENFYQAISLATKGEASRKNLFGWLGRIIEGLWLLASVAVIAYVASAITSVMTAAHISNRINSVADLQGKIVGVRYGSIAENYVKSLKIKTKPFHRIEEAADALLQRKISAVVDDNPVLEYFSHAHPDLPLDVVGNIFHPDNYGFAFPVGSPLTKPVSMGIIGLQESGDVEKLRTRYFGFKP